MPRTTSFPFLFWGRLPGDWLEGANDGHLYEVRFVRVPTPADRLTIAAALHRAMKKGPASAASADWKWSGAWARFFVGERRAGTAPAVFEQMEAVFRAIHEVAPIAEVVFWGAAAAGTHAWDAWTRARAKAPTPGPPWAGLAAAGIYGAARDRRLEAGTTDLDFEVARTGRKPSQAGTSALRVMSTLEAGFPDYPDDVPTNARLGGVIATRAAPGRQVVALTRSHLVLVDKAGKVLGKQPAHKAVQLAVTTDGAVVTMAPNNEVRAYRVMGNALAPLAAIKVKKGGSLWAVKRRVFYCAGASAFEISGF